MIVKKGIMSGKLWLHHERGHFAKNIVISSHGGYYQSVRGFKIGTDCAANSKIHFYQPGGHALDLDISFSVSGKKLPVIESHSKTDNPHVMNYQLTKFQGNHGPGGKVAETYDQIADAMRHARGGKKGGLTRVQEYNNMINQQDKLLNLQSKGQLNAINQQLLTGWTKRLEDQNDLSIGDIEERDVVSVRNRSFNNAVYLKDVIKALHKINPEYENFYCSFCRVFIA